LFLQVTNTEKVPTAGLQLGKGTELRSISRHKGSTQDIASAPVGSPAICFFKYQTSRRLQLQCSSWGRGQSYVAKADIKAAYRILPAHP
jgi:hypothetical protein